VPSTVSNDPVRRQWIVGAVKVPHAQRDVAHAVITEADDRGFFDVIGADTPDDHDVFPVGVPVTYRVELTDAEAERFRRASNCRYVELDVEAHDTVGATPIPAAASLRFMDADFDGVAAWHGRDVVIGLLDGGTTAAVRSYIGATMIAKQVFGPDAPGPDEITSDHGCLVAPCLIPSGGRFLDAIVSSNAGSRPVSASVAAARWCADQGAKVINYSGSGSVDSSAWADMLQYLLDRNVQFFASMGNDGVNQAYYPAAYSTTFANCHSSISFDTATGHRSTFSNYTATASGCAPGTNVLGLTPAGVTTTWSGTSASAPHMARLCAMGATGGRFTPAAVGAALKAHCRNTGQPAAEQGGGAYDLRAALVALGGVAAGSVDAGVDAQIAPGATFTRTATETGFASGAIATRVWTLGGAPATTADPTVAAERYSWGTPDTSSDELNYSGAPNSTKWGVYNGAGNGGHGVRSPSRVTVNGSTMVLTGLAGSANTAGLEHKLNQRYGRWEVRCRSSVTGTAASNDYNVLLLLWTDTTPWPNGGEIDFLEKEAGSLDGEAFWHYASLDGNDSFEHFTFPGLDMTQWHNYALEWSTNGIVSYVDGVEWARKAGGKTSTRHSIQAMPDPMHLAVQLDADADSGFRAATMEVDWVRVYPIVASGTSAGAQGVVGSTIGTAAALSWTAPTTAGTYVLTYAALDAGGAVLASDQVTVEVTTNVSIPIGTPIVVRPGTITSVEAFGVPKIVQTVSTLPLIPTWPGAQTFPGPSTFPGGSLDTRYKPPRTGWTTYPGPTTYPGAMTWPGFGLPGGLPPYHVEFFLLTDFGGYRCALPDVKAFSLNDVANDAGSVSIDYPVDGTNFDMLRSHVDQGVDARVAVRFAGSAEWELQAILSECDGDDVAEGAVWQFRGAWTGTLLDEAVVYPDPSTTDGKAAFTNASAGAVMLELVVRAQERGGLDIDTGTFSPGFDSHGALWTDDSIASPSFAPGDSSTYLRVLGLLADAGLCEWEMRGRQLRLYPRGGRGFDRTIGTPVILQGGRDLLEASRRHNVRGAVTSLLVLGAGGDWVEAADATALGRRRRRVEGATSQGSLSGGSLRAYARAKLATATTAAVERVHKLAVVDQSPLPMRDFAVGDWVWSDSDGQRRRLRVQQWTLTLDDQGLSGSVSLGDLIDDPLLKLARKVLGIGDGSTVVGGIGPASRSDQLVPAAPTGLTVDSVTSAQADGSSIATLLASWDPVVVAQDGVTGVNVDGYRLRWRYATTTSAGVPLTGEWTLLDDLDTATTAQVDGIVPAAQVEVQVGAWSTNTVTPQPPQTPDPTPDPGTGGTGGGTTTPVPTTIADALRLGTASGLTKVNIGIDFLPGDGPSGSVGKHKDYSLAEIIAGLDSHAMPKYVQMRPDGAVRLTSFVGAATTPNSTHSRTEFRELGPDGKSLAKWSSKSGRHYVYVVGAIIKLPKGRQRCCICQVHTPLDDLAMVLVDQGVNVESTYGDTGRPGRLTSSLQLGRIYQYGIELVREGSQTLINFYWDDPNTPKVTKTYAGGDGCFIKFGNYQQSDTQRDSRGETCIIDLYDAEIGHDGTAATPRHPFTPGRTDPLTV
jgi:hypothetical protein